MRLPARLRPLLALLVAIWAVEAVQMLTGYPLNRWLGLVPRDLGGLAGVPAMPFLHGSLAHAAANTLPLAVLGAMGFWVAPRRFLAASVAIVLVSGLAVWFLGRGHSVHVGASGLVFGWFGFLIALGVLERSPRAIAGAVAVIAIYGGLAWGMLPRAGTAVSWEAHLFGVLAGAGIAWLARNWPRRR